MKDETKRNIKETLENIALALLCLALVLSLNQKCANMVQNDVKQKLESSRLQQKTR